MAKLTGRVALVTGGQRGLGAAILRELATEGATCVVNYPGPTEMEEAAALVGELAALGISAAALAADVSETGAVGALVEDVRTKFGGLDILVNNAGVNSLQTWEEIESETWDAGNRPEARLLRCAASSSVDARKLPSHQKFKPPISDRVW